MAGQGLCSLAHERVSMSSRRPTRATYFVDAGVPPPPYSPSRIAGHPSACTQPALFSPLTAPAPTTRTILSQIPCSVPRAPRLPGSGIVRSSVRRTARSEQQSPPRRTQLPAQLPPAHAAAHRPQRPHAHTPTCSTMS
ncbi:hypothetical protein P153DRAFT_390532 [Dothidotthia symphoricarpi CBS 119687]|uniref:Uncharacterized protein n=1 Tax=Dothidotthia symphoricarpi CBS 119687 TaxID=1392245 RepID=A0A6A5ZY74_9PLEO|nr:uncharacterized protein P153DRAFT_390532 [Dothidotthia symphoricarpi CBS 119687]KAF2124489.1 hypothetical protein P153DRAFT_390532 [Dothidotthia symphoricarpi CBS 119687]